jgi:regulator of sigma E protease
MNVVHTVVAFVVALGVLILVHEYGHYLAARLFDVKVLRFSIGFGKPLLAWQRGPDRTEWTLAAVPFGGYVKMLDEREGPVEEHDLVRAFNRQSVVRRIVIVAAGPVFNFLFAIAVYGGLYVYGLPEARPVLAQPPQGTLAAAAGLQAGDTVLAVDGERVSTWDEARWRVVQAAVEKRALLLEIEKKAGENPSAVALDLRSLAGQGLEGDAPERIGLRLYRPELAPVIGGIVDASPASRAGLVKGDRITYVDGTVIGTWTELVRSVRASPDKTLRLTVERDGVRRYVEIVPEAVTANGERIGRIGASPFVPPSYSERIFVRKRYGPVDGFVKASVRTWEIATFSLRMLTKMLVGEVSWKHLSGPVTIADFAGQSAQLGWISYVTFLAVISISLGVLNLLPIPMLDGGHLMYYAFEVIKGGPVSERAMEIGQRVGLALLMILIAFALYNDFNRLLSG